MQVISVLRFLEARSSVGERYLDAVEVGGSIPPAPTNFYVFDFIINRMLVLRLY